MNGDWSNTVENLAPLPSDFSSSGSSARTPLAAVTVLPSAVLVTISVSDGLPLTREIDVEVTGSMTTSATWLSRTGPSVPCRRMFAMSSTDAQVCPTWTSRLSEPVSTVPAGIAVAFAVKNCAMVEGSTPSASIWA